MLFSEHYFMLFSSSSEKGGILGWEHLQSSPPSIRMVLFGPKVLFVSRPKGSEISEFPDISSVRSTSLPFPQGSEAYQISVLFYLFKDYLEPVVPLCCFV
jgi:hypothetical protein